jgi:hypothetical protein
MRRLLFLVVIGCGGSSAQKVEPPPAPAAVPVVAKTTRYVFRSEKRKTGTYVVTTAGPNASFVIDVLDNGRGPHVEAKLTFDPDGIVTSFAATGHHTMGAKVAETFNFDGKHAKWDSDEEHGHADAKQPTFYNWMSEGTGDPWMVPAALKHGGTLALWPAGEATVKQIADDTFAGRALVGYEVSGFGYSPFYSWWNKDGTYFGFAQPGFSMIPEDADEAVADAVATKVTALTQARGEDLARTTAHKPPAEGVAYTHARVLDVVKGAWLADQTVLVVGDKITALGKTVKIPAGAETVDLAGKALIPGLVDMHSHTDRDGAVIDIATGVTTVRDVGNDPDDLDLMKEKFDAGSLVGPHLVRMGFIEGRNEKAASSKVTAETPDEAKAAVEFFAKRHYEGIKIYNSVKPELVPLLAKEAHARGMLVTGHIPVHMLAHEAVDAGYDGIEHINMLFLNFLATHDTDTRDTTRFTLVGDHAGELDLDGKPMRDFIAQLVKHHTVIDPTLGVFANLYVHVPGQIEPMIKPMVERLPVQSQRNYLPGALVITPENKVPYAKAWTQLLALTKLLWQSKVPVMAGTDSGEAGLALHLELEILVQAGIPIADVLRLATVDAAKAMHQDFGTIAVGKRADLVVVDGDPLAEISQLRKVVSTMRSGVIYQAKPLLDFTSVTP